MQGFMHMFIEYS